TCGHPAGSTLSTAPMAGWSTMPAGSPARPPRSASGGTILPDPPTDLNPTNPDSPSNPIGPDDFRHVLGHFCTGVTIITTEGPSGPAGFACQAFAALSLTPPLVLFCPSRTSSTWPVIERSGHFCVNVLTDGQQELARRFGTSGGDKFAGVPWSASPGGSPVLDGALTWVEC